ncbi:hypothetical protein QQX84_16645 [Klebsiella pneumoniae]
MILTEYRYDPKAKDSKSVYLVRHNSRIHQTVLEQHLTIERDSFGRFIPTIELKDFPEGLSDRESMLKLADWLHRLGVAIEDNWSQPMTKSTITRARLETLANAEYCKSNPGAWLLGLKEVNELARMALAAMDGEPVRNPVLAYADSYRDMAKQGVESVPIWSVITDLERNIAPLYRHAQPAPVVPEGWAIADAVNFCKETGRQDAGAAMDAWNACRAAMLNGGKS